jgi:two-component system OmpR family sensor kinase
MTDSLQLRLSLWIAGCILLTGLAAGALSFLFAFDDANELQDGQLRQIAALAAQGRLGPAAADPTGDDSDAESRIVIRRWTPASHAATQAAGSDWLPAAAADGLHTWRRGEESWRVALRTLPSGERVAVAQPTSLRNEIAVSGAVRTIVPLLLLLPLLIVVVVLLVRAMLAAVQRLSVQVHRRQPGDQDAVDATGVPAEIVPFVAAINSLLARVGQLVSQQQRFIADAAHELRTPVTALGLQAENLARVQLPPQARERLVPLQAGLARTRALLEQLLSLAAQQATPAAGTQARLDEVAVQAVQDLLPLARARHVQIAATALQSVRLPAAEMQLAALVRNAIDNAVRYTAPGSTVEVSVTATADQALLEVCDRGPGLPPAERRRVFEPFYRVPGSTEGGSGLGLAIVRAVAERLGGTVELSERPGGGLCFHYRQGLHDR